MKAKAGDKCEECSGTGLICRCCASALDDCECDWDAEPDKCDICEGRGFIDELHADWLNSNDEE